MTRLLTAAFLIPGAWYLCKRAPFSYFLAAALLLTGLAAWECTKILSHRGSRPFVWLTVPACLGVVGAFALKPPLVAALAVLTAAALLSPALAMLFRKTAESMLDATMTTFFPVLFVGLPFAFVVGLEVIPGANGPDLLLLAMVCVTLSDAGAYYAGSTLGTHPMAPVISPKKSWEGAVGGVVASVGGALVAHFWFFRKLPLAHAVSLGVVLSTAGILGDLAESMLKRAAGVKDSSALLPGHGGVLDRLDSLLVAAPVLYYYWMMFLAGTPE
jgi:phosphatidate cytidylyltransferase